jgi:hypothetical protein
MIPLPSDTLRVVVPLVNLALAMILVPLLAIPPLALALLCGLTRLVIAAKSDVMAIVAAPGV